jgi:hypothetical protein
MTSLTSRFSPSAPLSYATGRYGTLIVAQGGGVRPLRWDGVSAATDAGMDAPTAAPSIAVGTDVRYYIARVDLNKSGSVYYAPPSVSFSTDVLPSGARTAVASSYLNAASVREIRTTDGGKGYTGTPTITLGDSHGKGAELAAILDIPDTGPVDPNNNPLTGISQWDVVSQPPAVPDDVNNVPRFAALDGHRVDLPITGNGTFVASSVTAGNYVQSSSRPTVRPCPAANPIALGYRNTITYTVSGVTAGSGAVLRLKWSGAAWIDSCAVTTSQSYFLGATQLDDAAPQRYGANYANNSVVTVTIHAIDGDTSQSVVIEGYTAGNERNTNAPRYSVKQINVVHGGSGYVVAPLIKITSASGFGAYATATVANGTITAVKLENGGGGYKIAPEVVAVSGGAEAFAVARPHLRGTYQCYVRYVDNTPEDRGGPVASNLSPLQEVDTGEGTGKITWTFAVGTGRQSHVELWRSTANEATTLYRVSASATSPFEDELTDDELRDANRADYAAMPIVMPNGELNANRFGIPPGDKAVVVSFQDRMWYAVDTGGTEPNVLYFSEVDEPESVPDINQVVVQQNVQSADAVTALAPFGSVLLVFQGRHVYSLTYVKKPLVDAQVSLMAYRGCLSQRCWDIHDGTCYVMDQFGVYSITPSGEISPLSEPIRDYFQTRIDFSSVRWFMVRFDPTLQVLRCFVACKEDNAQGFATRCLTYHVLSKAWWEERFPQRLSGSTQVKMDNGDFRCIYGGQGGVYLLGEGTTDSARGTVLSVKVTNRGAGYRTPPAVTLLGGSNAALDAVLDTETGVASIWIKSGGFGYTTGSVQIGPPNDPTHPAPVQAVAEFVASPLDADLPVATSYLFRSGNFEYPTDATGLKSADPNSRAISLLYAPQQDTCTVSLRMYYNNAKHPRRNLVYRDRGVGMVHSDVEPAARLDMSAYTKQYGESSGVAKALFIGRSADDVQGTDRHVAIELDGVRSQPDPVIFYSADVYGGTGAE